MLVSIYMNGEDKTRQMQDWEIWWGSRKGELMLKCQFPSGKSFSSPLRQCKVVPTVEIQEQFLAIPGKPTFTAIESAVSYGGKFVVVRYPGDPKPHVLKADAVVFSARSTRKDEAVYEYFVSVAKARIERAKGDSKAVAENVLRQMERLLPRTDTALHAYSTRQVRAVEPVADLIYPFGVNPSQLSAVEQALSSQVSVIEGPPGTGKTQTILNIIANILVRGKTVAILSNNNAAVQNVYEKLEKTGLAYLVAQLGKKEIREAFFHDRLPAPTEGPSMAPEAHDIQRVLEQLKQQLHAQNLAAKLQAEIAELVIERQYLLQWQKENGETAPFSLKGYRLSPRKTADLLAYMAYLAENRIKFKDRLRLLLDFKIFRTRPFQRREDRRSMVYALQLHYYDRALREKQAAREAVRQELERTDFQGALRTLMTGSMAYLKAHLHRSIPTQESFDGDNYRKKFDAFLKRYPIIASSTHSIVNSLADGGLLDYAIIDEASQQDIVPGVLALGCARNLIIVGDRKQLPHIPANSGVIPPSEFYDCDKYSLLDSCIGVFTGGIPMTLLKEHYRCHPKIIQFCNQQFYDGQLIPMTQDAGNAPLRLLITAKGNHARRNANLRELDSLLETLSQAGEIEWDGEKSRGFIAPYNAQVNLSRSHLPEDFIKDTVHKFQGRECEEMVFSTVLDKKVSSQRNLDFVDDPHLINVAVSRAKHRFTLVTGNDVFATRNSHISALMRYMAYYAEEQQIYHAPVVSAFDLLYQEYDESLRRLNARLRPEESRFRSEQIVAQLLHDALAKESCRGMTFHTQVALIQLASWSNEALTPREREFMKNRAICDFVIYFKVGKTPVGVIEVDGGHHDEPMQIERDLLKDSILDKSGISLLRLKTVESRIEEKIARFVSQWETASAV